MCTGAILLYGIPRVVIGENTTFKGDEELLQSRGVEVVVLDNEKCKSLMRDFIRDHPEVCHFVSAIFGGWPKSHCAVRNGMKTLVEARRGWHEEYVIEQDRRHVDVWHFKKHRTNLYRP